MRQRSWIPTAVPCSGRGWPFVLKRCDRFPGWIPFQYWKATQGDRKVFSMANNARGSMSMGVCSTWNVSFVEGATIPPRAGPWPPSSPSRTRARAYSVTFAPMDNRMIRTRKRLFTQAELAASLGCSTGTIKRLERSFLTDRQRAYLNAVGYSIGYYPKRNKLSVCTTATESPGTSGLQDEVTDG